MALVGVVSGSRSQLWRGWHCEVSGGWRGLPEGTEAGSEVFAVLGPCAGEKLLGSLLVALAFPLHFIHHREYYVLTDIKKNLLKKNEALRVLTWILVKNAAARLHLWRACTPVTHGPGWKCNVLQTRLWDILDDNRARDPKEENNGFD